MSGVCQFKPIIPYLNERKTKANTGILAGRSSTALLIRPALHSIGYTLLRNISDEPQSVRKLDLPAALLPIKNVRAPSGTSTF